MVGNPNKDESTPEFSMTNSTITWEKCKKDEDCANQHVCVNVLTETIQGQQASGHGCANELVCQGSGHWVDLHSDDTYQYFCDEEQKSKIANIQFKAPYQSFVLLKDPAQEEWEIICKKDKDCGETQICNHLQAYMDDTLNSWIDAHTCDDNEGQYYEVLCAEYGDFTLTNEDYDGTYAGYQISYDCDRHFKGIGSGAQAFAATITAALSAFLLLF